jgi:hypothetical protein
VAYFLASKRGKTLKTTLGLEVLDKKTCLKVEQRILQGSNSRIKKNLRWSHVLSANA